MKKLFLLIIPAMMLIACNNADKKTDDKCCDKEKCEQSCKDMITVDDLLANLDENVGKEVTVCGKCIHVCEHSGKNIFLANPENDSIMIIGKAGEGIEAFDKALVDKQICLKGTLKSVEVEGDEAEVHHDITVEYYIEVSEAKECCSDKKDSKCCDKSDDSKKCCDKSDENHKGCADKKDGEHKCGHQE